MNPKVGNISNPYLEGFVHKTTGVNIRGMYLFDAINHIAYAVQMIRKKRKGDLMAKKIVKKKTKK